MKPLVGYAAYLPGYRLAGADIGVRRGDRVVAAFDEDSTTMAVAASAAIPRAHLANALYFATSTPAYADKTNATAIHAALGLPLDALAVDFCGSGRSGFAAILAAANSGGIAASADVRVGRPGSADEKLGGDGAAALMFGDDQPAIAEVLAVTSLTAEFLDRWRATTSVTGEQWEERFGAERYADLIRAAVERVLDTAGLTGVDHVVLTCPNAGIVKRAATLVKADKSVVSSPIGFSGACDAALALCGVLDTAEAGETVLMLSAVDGCDALLLRTTGALPETRQPHPVTAQREGGVTVGHLIYLSWRGLVELEPPRRPEPDRPSGPAAGRSALWKFGLCGSKCEECGFIHLPPARVCKRCGATDRMAGVPVAGLRGAVATYTVDHLAYSPSPPVVSAVIDVAGGGRFTCEVADAEPERLQVGSHVEFTFRRLFTAGDVHNYFWKARLDGRSHG
ncbi:hydroxymethylglutaryl-CoA synthase [Mycobacterium florentinum]|uniref:Hydroxymethylglutaryl-CoA synthase n=1 Tax=Mycobacterium florentinum TaxID=292462 RepID=A0A1X1UC74_MYCFL|nr:OB-fold domain-containing protein [Mycobacterium florentinum]MCV7412348.1 OB-fold domain-containing protein [Mycobacterium florentinum]ORV54338.1 hydroxymethylglutaryl-CoA synthase [Mycobacterium florentinum]